MLYFRLTFLLSFLILSFLTALGQDTAGIVKQAEAHFKKGEALAEEGRKTEAVVVFENARALYKQIDKHEQSINCTLQMARCLDGVADALERRTELVELALREVEQYLPSKEHSAYADALQQKGELLIFALRFDTAVDVLSQAADIHEKLGAWEEVAWVLVTSAVGQFRLGQYTKMAEGLQKARRIAEGKIKEPDEHLNVITQLETVLFEITGDFEAAFNASQRTIKWLQDRPMNNLGDSVRLANAYNNHGVICYDRGDYDEALQHYQIALALRQEMSAPYLQLVENYNNIGLCYKHKGDWDNTRFFFNESIKLLPAKANEENYRKWVQTHYILAGYYLELKNDRAALDLLNKALPVSRKYGYKEEWVYQYLGEVYFLQKNYTEAITYFERALALQQKKHGKRHPDVGRLYTAIGDAYQQSEKPNEALRVYQKGLIALSNTFADSTGYTNPALEEVNALNQLLPLLESKGALLYTLYQTDSQWKSPTKQTYQLAITTVDQMRQRYRSDDAKILLSSTSRQIYEGAIQFLFDCYQKEPSYQNFEEAFSLMEKSKSLALLESIRQSKILDGNVNQGHRRDTQFYRLLNEEKSILQNIFFFEQKLSEARHGEVPSDDPRIKNAEKSLAQLYQANARLQTIFQEHFPAYYQLQYEQGLATIPTVQENLLSEDTGLLEYFVGPESVFLIFITDDGQQFHQLDKSELVNLATGRFREQLMDVPGFQQNSKAAFQRYNTVAFELYQILMGPVSQHFSSPLKKLIIIPDGSLHTIPFEVLNNQLASDQYNDFGKLPLLFYQYQFQYGYSASMLLENQERHKALHANVECLAFAPAYQTDDNRIEPKGKLKALRGNNMALEGTADEIREIARHLDGKYEFGARASKQLFKEEAKNYGILHLAMHGNADFANGKSAHLVFADQQLENEEDNLLFYYEIMNLNLNAQLAVLSACETGAGKYEAGEGVFSLARSFMHAGVPSVVMSLWKVNDQSTSQFMPYFYENLAKGKAKDKALQQAKLRFLEEAAIEYRHPYYWSGFVALGDPQPLNRPFPFAMLLGGVVLVGLALGGARYYLFKTTPRLLQR